MVWLIRSTVSLPNTFDKFFQQMSFCFQEGTGFRNTFESDDSINTENTAPIAFCCK